MTLFDPNGTHVGDEILGGLTLLAYCSFDNDEDECQAAIALIPKDQRAKYDSHPEASGYRGNYLTFFWDGREITHEQAHWNIVAATNRYADEMGADI